MLTIFYWLSVHAALLAVKRTHHSRFIRRNNFAPTLYTWFHSCLLRGDWNQNWLRSLGAFGRVGLMSVTSLSTNRSTRVFSKATDVLDVHRELCSIERCCFRVISLGFDFLRRSISHLMTIKKVEKLFIATFQHTQDLWMTPCIHMNRPNLWNVYSKATMTTTALDADQSAEWHVGPFWISTATIYAAIIARNGPQ